MMGHRDNDLLLPCFAKRAVTTEATTSFTLSLSLRVLMEESRLRGKGLHCCFVDFKKAFDMVPREHLWRRMEELEVPS